MTPYYSLAFLLPTARDLATTLARVEVHFGDALGVLHDLKLTGIIIKEGAPSRIGPSQPFVYFPSRFTKGGLGRSYFEPVTNEHGASLERLRETILATYQDWLQEQRAAGARI